MLDPLEFGRKEFKRRKFQFLLVFLGLVICVASTVFLVSLGQSLGFTIFSKSTGQFTAGISNIISSYISFVSILIFLSGMLTAYFLLSSMMAERIRDIGLIKTIGDVDKQGVLYLMSAPLLVIVSASSVGGIVGISASIAVAVFLLQLNLSSAIINGIVVFLGIVLLSILLSWVVVARRTDKAFKMASADLLSGDRFYFDFEKERVGLIKRVAERFSARAWREQSQSEPDDSFAEVGRLDETYLNPS